ncbi:metallophosphoesterase family protein [Phaeobacter marinintestinus]|uniref:metallophosphoesterase family protein n=1 Tax=Falsiphaeobacter marinintestinus TaxID=1492905 RepID=UPI0011B5AB44|nr:metallophosphoesterase family protein [Phaeobacter marinintestinus]
MKILAFSDVHMARSRAADLVAASAEADLVIGAGDFCNMRQGLTEAMEMFAGVTAPMIVVPGNAESHDELAKAANPNMTVLHGSGCKVLGLEIFGLGYAVPETPFGGWSCDLSEDEAERMLAKCENADIMVVHSPPKGVADVTSAGLSIGSVAIHAAIERVQPKLALCGHIHDCWGRSGKIGETLVCNLGPTVTWFEIDP